MRRTTIHSKAELEAIDAAMSALPSAMKRLESELTPRMERFGASCDGILNQSFEMSDVMAAHGIQGAQKERRHHAEVDHVDAMLRPGWRPDVNAGAMRTAQRAANRRTSTPQAR